MPLEIQKYLMEGHAPESLSERGIYSYRHPSLPLIGFKYDQIEAPRNDPIVRESRGIVLELDTWRVVAKGFNRFFNLGEFPDELAQFDWSNFTVNTKEDGSLILLYFYDSAWHVNTSGSFGLGRVNQTDKTWRDLFWETAALNGLRMGELNPRFTYIFELCTGYNKVVRRYAQPSLFLLSIFDPVDNCWEIGEFGIDAWSDIIGIKRPRRWNFTSRESLVAGLDEISAADPSFEGFVIRDKNNNRWKCKTASYAALHHMKDNGNILLPSRLTAVALKGETNEVKAIMPEISSALDFVDSELKAEYNGLENLWNTTKDITSQKDFAMAVKNHRFSGLLFSLRKNGGELSKLWRADPEKVSEKVFGNRTFQFDIV